jgi:hypothetical protein
MSEFYVYLHKDPLTQEVVYVGKGKYGRAWDVTRSRANSKDHQAWMEELSLKGYIPCDWVVILERNLEEAQAFQLEKETLYKLGVTKFNRQSGEKQHQAKLSDAQAIEIYHRVWRDRESPRQLSKEFGVSRACIYMIKKKKQWKTTLAKEKSYND